MIEKGITPAIADWPLRAKQWFYTCGGKLHPLTGQIMEPNDEAYTRFITTCAEAREGKINPKRENEELTIALGNPEHPGQTRGKGVIPWRVGFSKYNDTYKSRQRKKKIEVDRWKRLEQKNKEFERRLTQQEEQLKTMSQPRASPQEPADPAFKSTVPSQRKSSQASTEVPANDAMLLDDAPMARYPVDDVTDKKSCELRQKMANLSMKVAVGYAIPSSPGQLYHCRLIPPGYACVGLNEFMQGFEELGLEILGGEGEATLEEIM
jgi:hypothetical protein